MKHIDNEVSQSQPRFVQHLIPLLFVGISLVAIVAAFALANSQYEFDSKMRGFAAVVIGYLTFCMIAYWSGDGYLPFFINGERGQIPDGQIESKLFSIEEAGKYFGRSLKSSDMFRLMASRINDLVSFDLCVLLMVDRSTSSKCVIHADGENAYKLKGIESTLDVGLAGKSFASGTVQLGVPGISADSSFPEDALHEFRSSVALPLVSGGEVFAVLQLFSGTNRAFDNSLMLIEAIAERITPMVLSTVSFEKNLSQALTDPITNLPNERAFYMIVENQIAEAQRNRDSRPLSILAIDIKNFNDVNERFGHATGDRMLNFVAGKIMEQLRQMDFFARASNDEFLVVLPTASAKIAAEILARIETEFVNSRFSVNEAQSVQIALNFGAASFWQDGETPATLLATARERKQQTKTAIPNKVVWFPTEYFN